MFISSVTTAISSAITTSVERPLARGIAAVAIAAGSVLMLAPGAANAADKGDQTECELTPKQKAAARTLTQRANKIVAVIDVVSKSDAPHLEVVPFTPEWLADIFGDDSACSAALDALAEDMIDAAASLGRYLDCMGAKMVADMSGAGHPGCDAEAMDMRATQHDVEVSAHNADLACSGSIF